jgi:hypothetical protein
MSREIKFRAWNKEFGLMEIGIEFPSNCYAITPGGRFGRFTTGGYPVPDGKMNFQDKSDTHVLMQYTGLKDKNGREIYDGDVIVFRDISGSGKPREFGPRKVRWYRDSCNFNVSRPGNGSEIEVIGNIYENPELVS